MPVEACKIECSKLAMDKGTELVSRLAEFMKEKLKGYDVKVDGTTVIVSGEGGVTKRKVRLYIKKFLHKNELKDTFKVIAGNAETFVIHKMKK
ncbi:MAG: 60S ribosomal protein L22 [Candidatus Baldrarchaeia archaeon]